MLAGLPTLGGRYPFEAFRSTYERVASVGTWIVPDVRKTTDIRQEEIDYYASQGVHALVNVPLVKAGQQEAVLCVVQGEARAWKDQEIELIHEVAERLWTSVERARAEAALHQSEERFRQFADASAFGLWMRNADTMAMEFASPAIAKIYGAEADALLGDVQRWSSLVIPEDREVALQHLEEAHAGHSVVHEFRIRRPSDGVFKWIRNKDFPLRDGKASPRIEGLAEDVTEAKLSLEHQAVLMAELKHRVRNIMGMIRSMANRTAPGAQDTEATARLWRGGFWRCRVCKPC